MQVHQTLSPVMQPEFLLLSRPLLPAVHVIASYLMQLLVVVACSDARLYFSGQQQCDADNKTMTDLLLHLYFWLGIKRLRSVNKTINIRYLFFDIDT